MFETIKLEKCMYNNPKKSFNQVLEEIDPSENYTETAYAGLDAFERQLKRFDIKVGGPFCDRVEKFFQTTESTVLFPEFVRRSIQKGFDDCPLDEITAANTFSESNYYAGCTISEASYTTATEGATMPASEIREDGDVVTLKKYGRVINSSYESIKQQRLDLFAVMLRSVGKLLASSLLTDAFSVLIKSSSEVEISGSSLAYADIANLYGAFTDYSMDTIIVSPTNAAIILAMDQLMESKSEKCGEIYLPFGAKMITSNNMNDNKILGIDSRFALEVIRSTDIILETDKLIDKQLNAVGVSINIGFKKIFSDAVRVLAI